MIFRAALCRIAVVVVASALTACGGAHGGSSVLPATGAGHESSVVRRPMAAPPSTPWTTVPLTQTITTVGGTVGVSDGVWVSDATSDVIQRVTAKGAVAYTVSAPHVYGLAAGSANSVVFDIDSGYGIVLDSGASQTYSVAMPAGEALSAGEIAYLPSQQTIFIGGSVTQASQCADTLYVFEAGGTSPFPYFGDVGTVPCGMPMHHLTSDQNYVWFGESNVTPHVIAAVSPSSPNISQRLPAAAAAASPAELIAGLNGDVYFSLCGATDTRPGGGAYMLRANASSTDETLYSTYAACADLTNSMVGDPNDGRVWIANGTNSLTAVRASDGAVSSYTLTSASRSTSGFAAVTVGPDRALWAFRNGDSNAYAFGDRIIAADPAYAYMLHGQPVTVTVSEYQYSSGFTAKIVSGSSPTCLAVPVPGVVQNTFAVSSASGTDCTVAFTDTAGIGTVYVPLVTKTNSNVPPQPHPAP